MNFRSSTLGESVRATIPNDFAAARAFQQQIDAALEDFGWSDSDRFSVRLAVEEASINAIRHGNRLDPSSRVSIQFRVESDSVEVRISDQGDGFCPESVPDPLLPENIERPSGRGLFLIRCSMCRVEFCDGGRTIVMSRRRRSW